MGFGGWYLGQYSADFDPSVYWDPAGMRASGGAPAAAPTPIDPMVLGKRVYNNCMACHQADGRGVPGNYPPLDGTEFVNGDPARMAALVLHGIEGELVVLGETYNQVMPKWSHLSDDQIAAVLTYVRSSWSNTAGPVEPSLVAAVRAATSDRRGAWRAAELDEFAIGFEPPQVAAAEPEGPPTTAGPDGAGAGG
jgi:mono/diheme cytochrome c family protein